MSSLSSMTPRDGTPRSGGFLWQSFRTGATMLRMRAAFLFGLCLPLFGLQAADELKPGLIGEYYDIGEELNDFPNIKGMTPSLRKIDPDVNIQQTNGPFNKSGLIVKFYVRWTGVVRIPKDGRYMFYT